MTLIDIKSRSEEFLDEAQSVLRLCASGRRRRGLDCPGSTSRFRRSADAGLRGRSVTQLCPSVPRRLASVPPRLAPSVPYRLTATTSPAGTPGATDRLCWRLGYRRRGRGWGCESESTCDVDVGSL